MRCIGCGDRVSRAHPGVAGAGLTLCSECITAFAAILDGRLPAPRTTALRMSAALVDLSILADYSDAQLRFELGVARDLAAPLEAFIDAARRRLADDPSWTEVEVPGPHHHCDDVVLPDGTRVRASSFPRPAHVEAPDLGVYLDPAWSPSWPHLAVEWEDLGLPADRKGFAAAVDEVLARARRGDVVEIGCLGGHGRTGTFLAVLAIRAGEPSRTAVEWVRAHYCHDAIETEQQEAFVQSF